MTRPLHPRLIRRLLLLAILCAPQAALAAPARYAIEVEKSVVGFETDFGPDKITGHMPVTRADLTLDFDQVANSTFAVTLDVAHADASFPFAAQAMKGPKVLDAEAHPTITFTSTRVRPGSGSRAAVEGNLTIRGVTRPATLQAELFRQDGSAANDLSHLTVRLTGAVKRSDFGATGWNDMVNDEVRLDILARIKRVD